MPITPTVRHLYVAAKAVGYTGPDDNPDMMKRYCADLKGTDGKPDPLEVFMLEDGTEVEIKSLAFDVQPVRTKRRSVRVAGVIASEEDRDDADAKTKAAIDKVVEDRLKAMGVDPNAKKRLPGSGDIGAIKSGEERMYEARIANKTSVFKSYDMALGFGTHIQVGALRQIGRHDEAEKKYAKTAEYLTQKGYTLTTTASGGALAPEGYDADLWQLLLEYGVARRTARVVNMATETIARPKASGDLTVYYPADGGAGTESSKTWSNVQMRAKEGMVIVKASRALVQDAAINVADDAGRDIVRAVAKVEDASLFNSDGTGVAGGYMPGVQGILNIISETSTGSRVFKSTATTPAGVTESDITSLMSTPGRFVGRMMAFHCTGQIGGVIFHRLAAAKGGVTAKEVKGLGEVDHYLNVPIIYNNVMTTNLGTGANRQLVVYGDISLAADFGDRMGLSVEISEQRYWDENNIGIKGTVRHDINVHGLGTSSTTGPLAVLLQS